LYRVNSRQSSGDLEAGPSGTYDGGNPFAAAMGREDLRNLKPILEDDGRPSLDVRRSSHMLEGANGEHVSAPRDRMAVASMKLECNSDVKTAWLL
jgi:hypothetical protein